MIKFFLPVFFALLLSGCFSQPKVEPNQRVYEQEDADIVEALYAEHVKYYKKSAQIFTKLYKKTDKVEYFEKALQSTYLSKNYDGVFKMLSQQKDENTLNKVFVQRIRLATFVKKGMLKDAKKLALKLLKRTDSELEYVSVASIYLDEKKYDLALKYFESGYLKNHSEYILNEMSIVLYVNLGRKKEAIAQLETYIHMYGCSKLVCKTLLGFYSNDNNINGILSVYQKLYEKTQDKEVQKKIIQMFVYKKDYDGLKRFLKKSTLDNQHLFEIYVLIKDFKDASHVAYKIYENSADVKYLSAGAMYEYESAKDKNNKKMLNNVISNLKKVLKTKKSGVVLNYLGYILIDHNIDVKQGVLYAKQALKTSPKNVDYLDSLGWGYYKLGKCKKAFKVYEKIKNSKGVVVKEILQHAYEVNKCNKGIK